MKDVILKKVNNFSSSEERFNILREFLQALVLKIIEESGQIKQLAFVGGTALRFLYDIKRFSEDLDFSLIDQSAFNFNTLIKNLERSFSAWDIKLEFKPKTTKTVVNTFLKFPELLFECGLSPRSEQKLFIKLEIDCNPPKGFATELSFNQKYLPMNILHYDLPSLFAGKLHAVLLRQYAKGRDFYDLMWFLGKKVPPNLNQLENAIYQTTGERISLNENIVKERLFKRIEEVDFKSIQKELQVFLEVPSELKYLTQSTLKQLING